MAEQEKIEQTTVTKIHTGPEEPKATILSSIIAIVGLIVLIVVIIWGLVHLASLSKSFFSSLFPRPVASITLSAPASATSRTPFTVSWNYKPASSGAYAFLYQCATGFQFETPSENGVSNQIPCGASFMLPSTTASLSLTPVLSGKSVITVPISVVFIPTATSSPRVQGNASIVINPAQTPAASAPAATVTNSTPAKPRASGPALAGQADLLVRIISVSADGYGNSTAVFDIENVGRGSSGTYYFSAELPTNAYGLPGQGQTYGSQMQSYTYNSPAQVSLAPGDHIVSTLRFTQAQTGGLPGQGVFSVTVDPSRSVNESNTTNNYAYQTLTGGYNYNYNQPQPYNYQQPYPYYTY